ncbi:MAG: hypothetical protein Kow00123_07850 [Anaerolineales bacterium]
MKKAWQQLLGWRWPIFGIVAGAILASVLGSAGVGITVEEGILWGAVAGLVVMYTPYFLRSGKMVTKRDNRVVNFVVGVFVFLGISAVIIAIFLGIFWVLSLFIR